LILVYNGSSIFVQSAASVAWQYQDANIYALLGLYDTHYIAKNGTDWYFVNPQSFVPESQLVLPAGYSIIKPYSTTDSISPKYYWQAFNNLGQKVLLQTTTDAVQYQVKLPSSFTASARAFMWKLY
jgi:hypothetical protein